MDPIERFQDAQTRSLSMIAGLGCLLFSYGAGYLDGTAKARKGRKRRGPEKAAKRRRLKRLKREVAKLEAELRDCIKD